MPSIPNWMTGRHVTTVTARWQTADATGLLANGAGVVETLTGYVDEITYAGHRATEMINALTSTRENEVVVESDDAVTLTEIMRNDDSVASAAQYNILAKLWTNADNADYILFTVTRAGNTFTFYGVMADYNESVRKGKCVARMTIQMIDIDAASANPSYS